ncbi:hypothetical protein JCM11491_005626 [Sporobolomyces phaffii]
MDDLTPPPTPPPSDGRDRLDSAMLPAPLALALVESPPSFASSDSRPASLVRPRCDSDQTLLDLDLDGGGGHKAIRENHNHSVSVALLEQELNHVRRQLKRAQQSIRDLRTNKGKLERKFGEQVEIARQAELDLDKVLVALNLERGAIAGGRISCGTKKSRGSSWSVVIALFVWVLVAKRGWWTVQPEK